MRSPPLDLQAAWWWHDRAELRWGPLDADAEGHRLADAGLAFSDLAAATRAGKGSAADVAADRHPTWWRVLVAQVALAVCHADDLPRVRHVLLEVAALVRVMVDQIDQQLTPKGQSKMPALPETTLSDVLVSVSVVCRG